MGLTLYLHRLSILAVSVSVVLAVVIGVFYFFKYTGLAYNLKPAAEKVKYLQEHGVPVVYMRDYQGQLQFLGRLIQPIDVVTNHEALKWANAHPDGYLISVEKKKEADFSYIQR